MEENKENKEEMAIHASVLSLSGQPRLQHSDSEGLYAHHR